MQIFVSGSLAFDRIMSFPGKFSDHILPDKIHILNVCFMVDGLDEKFGGTAGNIAYSLALMEEKPTIVATAGKDFAQYGDYLQNMGLSLDGVRVVDSEFTAGAYITTDQSDNQITGFNPGAMKFSAEYDFSKVDPADAMAIISPGCIQDMNELPTLFKEKGIRYIFDPGQSLPAFSGDQLKACINGASLLITNDYELQLIMNATGLAAADIDAMVEARITTLGEKGSLVVEKSGETTVPPAKIEKVVDPTGAGDAYRAGLLKGLTQGKSLVEAAHWGSACAVYSVEKLGTQEHRFTLEEYLERLKSNFGDVL